MIPINEIKDSQDTQETRLITILNMRILHHRFINGNINAKFRYKHHSPNDRVFLHMLSSAGFTSCNCQQATEVNGFLVWRYNYGFQHLGVFHVFCVAKVHLGINPLRLQARHGYYVSIVWFEVNPISQISSIYLLLHLNMKRLHASEQAM